MKKTVFILVSLLLTSVGTIWSTENVENNNVIINKGGSRDLSKEFPRSLIEVPITCTYQNGFLFFTFMEDLGEVEISVTNLSTGAEIFDEIDSFCGNALLEVSESSGEYQIEITTENDDSYYGEYIL